MINTKLYIDHLVKIYINNSERLKQLLINLKSLNVKNLSYLKLVLDDEKLYFRYAESIETEDIMLDEKHNTYTITSILYMNSDIHPKYNVDKNSNLFLNLNKLKDTDTNKLLNYFKDDMIKYLKNYIISKYAQHYLKNELMYIHYKDLNTEGKYLMMYNFIKNYNGTPFADPEEGYHNSVVKHYCDYFKNITPEDFFKMISEKGYGNYIQDSPNLTLIDTYEIMMNSFKNE